MIITRQWMKENATEKGAWTKAQLAVLGIAWPPATGWIDDIVGCDISESTVSSFISARELGGKRGRSIAVADKPSRPARASAERNESATAVVADLVTTGPGATKLWFGKHKGKRLCEVPREYLEWCLKERAGGSEIIGDIAAVLAVPVPIKVVKYAAETLTRAELERIKGTPGYQKINKIVDGIDVMGVTNCEHLFNPDATWPERQEWDGITAPWLDQSDAMDDEFKSMFR